MNRPARSEAFYAALLQDDAEQLYERAPCGYLTTSTEGLILKVNGTFCDMTGYRREDLVGHRTFSDLLTAGGRIYHETHYAPTLRMQSSMREVALDVVTATGERLPALINAVLERDDQGTPRLIRVAVFDATDRRAYERELSHAKQCAEQSEIRAQALARTLQSTLIPPSPPTIPGLDVSAAYQPAGDGQELGGDFYDVFQIKTGDWVVALGDVCGKGIDAAVMTALVRHTLRALTVQQDDPSQVLHSLNDVLIAKGDDRFCTVAVARLRHHGALWSATLSAGGHPLPLHLTLGGQLTAVGSPGSLVGVISEVEFTDTELKLAPGDLLVMYTDGVTEGRRGLDFYGEQRLHASVIAHQNSVLPAQAIVQDVLAFQGGTPRDDIAVIAVRVPRP